MLTTFVKQRDLGLGLGHLIWNQAFKYQILSYEKALYYGAALGKGSKKSWEFSQGEGGAFQFGLRFQTFFISEHGLNHSEMQRIFFSPLGKWW